MFIWYADMLLFAFRFWFQNFTSWNVAKVKVSPASSGCCKRNATDRPNGIESVLFNSHSCIIAIPISLNHLAICMADALHLPLRNCLLLCANQKVIKSHKEWWTHSTQPSGGVYRYNIYIYIPAPPKGPTVFLEVDIFKGSHYGNPYSQGHTNC